ncbi:MAG: GNAT family N-acetyltransferase [Clostridia bacterium]
MIKLVKTNAYALLQLKEDQLSQISSEENINIALKKENCIGFYAYEEQNKIGFALLREFKTHEFFLWDFIVDCRYQSSGKGKLFLKALINVLVKKYSAELLTTTYVYGNTIAKKLYNSLGFIETDVVNENGVHEVNMKLTLQTN